MIIKPTHMETPFIIPALACAVFFASSASAQLLPVHTTPDGEEYVTSYYTDGDCHLRNFDFVDLFSLPGDVLRDSLGSAVGYLTANNFFDDNGFAYLYIPGGTLTCWRTKMLVDPDGNETEVREIIPVPERQAGAKQGYYHRPGAGMPSYLSLAETLSARRAEIDFCEFYETYGVLFRRLVSRRMYAAKYSRLVDILLIAHEDLDGKEWKYDFVESIIESHWNHCRKVPNYAAYLGSYYEALRDKMGAGVEERLRDRFSETETDYSNRQTIVWANSFWYRRRLEGKTDEIRRLLSTVRDDFAPRTKDLIF